MNKRLILLTISVCTFIITAISINTVSAASIIAPEALNQNQKVSFNYEISSSPVGDIGLYQISLDIKVENSAVGGIQFRLGWDDSVVSPSRATGTASNINTPVTNAILCFSTPNEKIDTKGHTIKDYMSVIANINMQNHFLYYIMHLPSSVLSNPGNYSLLDANKNLATNGKISFGTITFQLREGKTTEDITSSTFFLITDPVSTPAGFKMSWYEGSTEQQILDPSFAKFVNFPSSVASEINEPVATPDKITAENTSTTPAGSSTAREINAIVVSPSDLNIHISNEMDTNKLTSDLSVEKKLQTALRALQKEKKNDPNGITDIDIIDLVESLGILQPGFSVIDQEDGTYMLLGTTLDGHLIRDIVIQKTRCRRSNS